MGNKILKVFLPLVVLAAIILVVVRAKRSIDNMAPADVKPFEFGMYVGNLIQANLEGKPYAEAKNEYCRIYDIIKTEEFLKTTDSAGITQPLLPDTTVQRCYQRAFIAYWPAFEGMVEGVFKYDWSYKTNLLDAIKDEAIALKDCTGSDVRNDSLDHYVNYVNDYNAARSFVDNISCSSKNRYNELLSQKDTYKKKYPLRNNNSLVSDLDDVPSNAKTKWRSSVMYSVKTVCDKSDLEGFITAKNKCVEKINEYNGQFPNDELSYAETKKKLNDHWYVLLSRAVDKAVKINNKEEFNPVCESLRNKIKDYGSDPDDLKGRLNRRWREVNGY